MRGLKLKCSRRTSCTTFLLRYWGEEEEKGCERGSPLQASQLPAQSNVCLLQSGGSGWGGLWQTRTPSRPPPRSPRGPYLDHLWELLHPLPTGPVVPGLALPAVVPLLDPHLPPPPGHKELQPSAAGRPRGRMEGREWCHVPVLQGKAHLLLGGDASAGDITCERGDRTLGSGMLAGGGHPQGGSLPYLLPRCSVVRPPRSLLLVQLKSPDSCRRPLPPPPLRTGLGSPAPAEGRAPGTPTPPAPRGCCRSGRRCCLWSQGQGRHRPSAAAFLLCP